MDNFFIARSNMVKGQIIPNKITNPELIEIILNTPRHLFSQEHFKSISYSDESIPLNKDRYLISPVVFARLLQESEISENDVVLDVACGSGYSCAVFSQLAKKIVAIESNTELASKAHLILNKMNIGNVIMLNVKLQEGHPESGPYNVIFLNGAIEQIPDTLLDQLAENGKLITVIKESEYSGTAVLFQRKGGKILRKDLFDAVLPVIPEFKNNNFNIN